MQKRIIQCTKCQVLQSDNGFPSCKECGAKLYKENSKMNSTDQSQQPTARELLEADAVEEILDEYEKIGRTLTCQVDGERWLVETAYKRAKADQPQQPTAREILEALIEYYDNNKRWFLSSSRRSGVEYKGLTGIALLEFAEQWLKEKTKER